MTPAGDEPRRPLNAAQATACEHSDSDRCSCRCGGTYHGAWRVDDVRALPLTDPHFPDRQMRFEDLQIEEREWRERG